MTMANGFAETAFLTTRRAFFKVEKGPRKSMFLADFSGCQTGGENAIQRVPCLIGEPGVKQGAEVGLSRAK